MQYTPLAEGGAGLGSEPGSTRGSVSGRGSESDGSPLEHDHVSIRSKSTRSFRTVSVGNQELKEPLTAAHDDDPFYVFREDLYRKLDLVDDGLAEYLRLVHHTVCYAPEHGDTLR
jgi:hypothetical protein